MRKDVLFCVQVEHLKQNVHSEWAEISQSKSFRLPVIPINYMHSQPNCLHHFYFDKSLLSSCDGVSDEILPLCTACLLFCTDNFVL